MLDIAGDRENLGALALPGTQLAKPVAAPGHNGPDVGISFGIIDNGGLAPQAFLRRMRWFGRWHRASALDAGNQGGLLPADKLAGAEFKIKGKIKTAAHDPGAKVAFFPGLGDGLLDSNHGIAIFRSNKNITLTCPDGVCPDQ